MVRRVNKDDNDNTNGSETRFNNKLTAVKPLDVIRENISCVTRDDEYSHSWIDNIRYYRRAVKGKSPAVQKKKMLSITPAISNTRVAMSFDGWHYSAQDVEC